MTAQPKAPIPVPHFRQEIKTSAAAHEVFLAFNSDWHAAAFEDWLRLEGFKRFAEWADCRRGEYE